MDVSTVTRRSFIRMGKAKWREGDKIAAAVVEGEAKQSTGAMAAAWFAHAQFKCQVTSRPYICCGAARPSVHKPLFLSKNKVCS